MMSVSPLLSAETVRSVADLLRASNDGERIQSRLDPLPQGERVHVLRYLVLRGELSDEMEARLQDAWKRLLPSAHAMDSDALREALWRQSEWWDAFSSPRPGERERYRHLEALLDAAGHSPGGAGYFLWIANHPPFIHLNGIWDEHRRGAITSLARYAFSRPTGLQEVEIARHLDDWINVQTDVIDILTAMKSSLLPRLAPWYIEHDPEVRPFLESYFAPPLA